MPITPRRYVIVGAGTFGSATALSLKRAEPDADVILVDRTPFPCPMGAGHDLNKIVRADYTDQLYMKHAIKALRIWNTDPLYSRHFHNTGAIYHLTDDFSQAVLDNWEMAVGKDKTPSRIIDNDEALGMFNGLFREADRTMVTSILWSPTAGWADSAAALADVIQAAVDLGVTYIQNSVTKVLLDGNLKCLGVETLGGETIQADQTILAAGAYIPWILANSAPERPEIHTHDRLIAVGAPMAAFRITDETIQMYTDWPVCELIAKLQGEYGQTFT
jgi:sarcosine oxidase/L-pipecolate oxidase